MNDREIFDHLFEISKQSDDTAGIVASCLVRGEKIVADAISADNGTHSEYALIKKLNDVNFKIGQNDIVYVTVEPCGKRNSERGRALGDCTTILINAGVKNIIFAAKDPDAAEQSRHKFKVAECSLMQIRDKEIIERARAIFNATVSAPEDVLPT